MMTGLVNLLVLPWHHYPAHSSLPPSVRSFQPHLLTYYKMSKEYGYCEITGEKIGIKRLEIMPLATLTIEAQEKFERNGSLFN